MSRVHQPPDNYMLLDRANMQTKCRAFACICVIYANSCANFSGQGNKNTNNVYRTYLAHFCLTYLAVDTSGNAGHIQPEQVHRVLGVFLRCRRRSKSTGTHGLVFTAVAEWRCDVNQLMHAVAARSRVCSKLV